MAGYRPRSLFSLAESPLTDPALGETLPAASVEARPANILSDTALLELWNNAVFTGKLRQVTVTTGGREPVETWASYLASGGQSQINVSRQYCPTTHSELLREWMEKHPGRRPSEAPQFKINVGQLAWRYQHRTEDGRYRKIPINLEISHMAEAYHGEGLFPRANPYRTGYKIELSNMEVAEVNESRKICNEQALMWRKPETGELIRPEEVNQYRGPTCCFHAAFGVPCYAPYPVEEDVATLKTPRKNRGKRSRTGTGEVETDKRSNAGPSLLAKMNEVA